MEDMETLEDSSTLLQKLLNFDAVADALRAAGYTLLEADIQYLHLLRWKLLKKTIFKKLAKLIDVLENDDDVQKVHHNFAGDL